MNRSLTGAKRDIVSVIVLSVGLLLIGLAPQGQCVELTRMSLGDISASNWSASNVNLEWSSANDMGRLEITVDEVVLPSDLVSVKRVTLLCETLKIEGTLVECPQAVLRSQSPASLMSGRFLYDARSGRAEFETRKATLGPLGFSLSFEAMAPSWVLRVETEESPLAPLIKVLLPTLGLPVAVLSGTARTQWTFSGEGRQFNGEGRLSLSQVAFSDESGLNAGEELSALIQGAFSASPSQWQFNSTATWSDGALSIGNFFMEVADQPLSAIVEGLWDPARSHLELRDFHLEHPEVVELQGAFGLDLEDLSLSDLVVNMHPTELAPLYGTYLQALAWGSGFGKLEVDGRVSLSVDWHRTGESVASATLDEVNFDDRVGRFAVFGADANLYWSSRDQKTLSSISWDGGSIYRIGLGPAEFNGHFEGGGFDLAAPADVGVLDGTLRLTSLSVSDNASAWQLSGVLLPTSLGVLSHSLGWPLFQGTIAGSIPQVQYRDGTITTDGSFAMRVFDGDVLVRDLRLSDPFSLVPVLEADVDIWGLSLKPLTEAFSFGSIEGKLDGYIHDLTLQGWVVESFDAYFATPENDDSNHKISQNAVENLAELGGGSGALSATFLRFLDEFSYSKLGIGCRLKRSVCEMRGVADADQGYYIVRAGGFPPRIDVLGFNRRVAWRTLLERLTEVSRSGGPVIEY